MAFKKEGDTIGVTFFDVATLKVYVGQFADDDHYSKLRTLVCQIRPVEVIHEKEFANSDIVKMLRNAPLPPVFSEQPPSKCPS